MSGDVGGQPNSERIEIGVLELYEEPAGIVRMVRRPGELEADLPLEQLVVRIVDALETLSPGCDGFLLDLRAGTGRNDAGFESMARDFNIRAALMFERIAWLVRSTVGTLQAQRYARDFGVNIKAFHDEDAAIDWLRTGVVY